MEITSCESADSGLYRCSAANPLGTDETTSLLHVEGKQIIIHRDYHLNILKKTISFYIEVRRTRRAHSARPGESDTSRGASRARSPSPVRSSGRDASWRDKLGAGDKPARDTLDVEKPSKF